MKIKNLFILLFSSLFLTKTISVFSMNQMQTIEKGQDIARAELRATEIKQFFELEQLEAETVKTVKAFSDAERKLFFQNLKINIKNTLNTIKEKKQVDDQTPTTKDIGVQIKPTTEDIGVQTLTTEALTNVTARKKMIPTLQESRQTMINAISSANAMARQKMIPTLQYSGQTMISIIDTAYKNKILIAKSIPVLTAFLYANHIIRGEKSLLSHIAKHGKSKAFSSLIDQCKSTALYIIKFAE